MEKIATGSRCYREAGCGSLSSTIERASHSSYLHLGHLQTSYGHYYGGNKWIGLKVAIYNINNDQHVKMEIWLDKNANNTWEKVNEFTDTGNWNADRSNFFDANCKDKNGAVKQRNHVINYAGPWASIRSDGMEFDFKNMSVREIAVPGASLTPNPIQTTPYAFGFTPFDFFAREEPHNDAD